MAVGQDISTPRAPGLCQVLTGLSLGLVIVCLCAGVVDDRMVEGAPAWAKPTKFALSFVVLFATLAWLDGRLSMAWREGRVLQITTRLMGVSMMAEMGYLMYQAALAEPSHYNYATLFNTIMYTVVMFVGALLLVVGIGIYAVVVAKDADADFSPGLRLGVVWGCALSCGLTLVLATYMSGQPTRFVGAPSFDAQTLPLLGWSLEVGDFRPSHFFALHAMQVLPVLGGVLDRCHIAQPTRHMRIAAALYAALTLGLFVQALAGLPLFSLTA